MPTITFSLDDLEQLSQRKITPEQLADMIHYAKGELEHYDKKTKEATVSLDDTNLPYLWSVEGLGRLYRNMSGKQRKSPQVTPKKSSFVIKVDKRVKKVREHITAFVATGPPLTDYGLKQLIQLQEKFCEGYGRKRKKVSIGIYTPQHITWPVHYTVTRATEHAFVPLQETKKMTPQAILKNHPKGREYGGLLKGNEFYPLLKDTENEVLSLPPIINSNKSGRIEVGETQFLFEATGGDERALHLGTAIFAQAFFERGYTIHEVTIEREEGKMRTPLLEKKTIHITQESVKNLLGLEFSESKIKELLEKAGFEYAKGKVTIPPYRDDILHPVDVIEDIAIMYGFHNITPEPLTQYTVGAPLEEVSFYDELREALVGAGYQEVFNQILTNNDLLYTKMNMAKKASIEIENYSSKKYNVVRSWILPLLMEILSKSKHADYPQHIFEQGPVAYREGQRIIEKESLVALTTHATANFSSAKQVLEAMLRGFGLQITLKEKTHPSFIEGRCATIIIQKKEIGYIGELHPIVLEHFGIAMPIACFTIDCEALRLLLS